jgi:hypothetical protein
MGLFFIATGTKAFALPNARTQCILLNPSFSGLCSAEIRTIDVSEAPLRHNASQF